MKYIKAIHCYFIRFLSETIFPAVIKCCNVFSITPATEEWPFGPDTLKSIAMESFFSSLSLMGEYQWQLCTINK